MPPKAAPSKKADAKKKEKLVEDKTFGLKNKKGAKQQKFVQQVVNQVKQANPAKEAEKKKKDAIDELADLNKLLKPVEQKVAKDVDPKSILCLFFKTGMCQKGNKCKFSHDLNIEQKAVKKNLYVDSRDIDKEQDNMDTWDEAKLTDVAETKHGEHDRKRANQTDIVCKYFIEAVENSKYGWFWECPNGSKCIYRHALPPGFVLKKDKKNLEDAKKANEISLEELIEKERAALSSKNFTKVTLQSFVAWKKRKLKEKKQKEEEEENQKREKAKSGKQGGLSGRDLFTFNPDMIQQDDDDADDVAYEQEVDENEATQKVFEIDENFFHFDGMEEMEEEENGGFTGVIKGMTGMEINADLFDVDDVAELDSDSDEEEEKGGGS